MIPKGLNDDVLWVSTSLGAAAAAEKAGEVLSMLHAEIASNPRVCVVQVLGGSSGFNVCHAVRSVATHTCDAALIPEAPFSIRALAHYIESTLAKKDYALVVMAEAAVPVDTLDFAGGLSAEEIRDLRAFLLARESGSLLDVADSFRSGALKAVEDGLRKLLSSRAVRVFTNAPRHLIRSVPPSEEDINLGHLLGERAVDCAMHGYTDVMIADWEEEIVAAPLRMVTIGSRRIDTAGPLWASVLARTGQKDPML